MVDDAAGPHLIKPVVLRELPYEILYIVSLMFQRSFDTGHLPSEWTETNVAPQFEKSDNSDPTNYRLISLTCVLCKRLEQIIVSSLSKHFSKHILCELQHGFAPRTC